MPSYVLSKCPRIRYVSRFTFLYYSKVNPLYTIGVAPIAQLRTCVIKIVAFKGGHLMWYHKELLCKERIRSLWAPILSFKRSSHM